MASPRSACATFASGKKVRRTGDEFSTRRPSKFRAAGGSECRSGAVTLETKETAMRELLVDFSEPRPAERSVELA